MIAYSIPTPADERTCGWCHALDRAVDVVITGEGETRCCECGSYDCAEPVDEDEAERRAAKRDDKRTRDAWETEIANERELGHRFEAQWREGILTEALATQCEDETLDEAIRRVIQERDEEEGEAAQ